jgi:nucleotide-binding universal stress UspA family protein
VNAIQTKKTVQHSPSGSAQEIGFKRILVPTDFSDYAEHALEYAVGLISLYRAQIFVLHVFYLQEYLSLMSEKPDAGSKAAAEVLEAAKGRAISKLEDIVGRLADQHAIAIPSLSIGVPFEEIVKYATEMDIDLIVMSTHGRAGLAHFLLGSTTERVISHATCPVLVVKQEQGRTNRRNSGANQGASS